MVLGAGAAAGPARAAWPGSNGKVFFTTEAGGTGRVWSVNPDGTDLSFVWDDPVSPVKDIELSPDGLRFV